MGLVKCSECKKEVSASAQTCPHCGVKSPASKVGSQLQNVGNAVMAIGCLIILVPIVLIMLGVMLGVPVCAVFGS